MTLPMVHMWCDGSGTVWPLPGGYAAVLRFVGPGGEVLAEREVVGGIARSTNNVAELTAAIMGLRALKRPCRVVAHCDSEYVVKGYTEWLDGWKRKQFRKIKNRELWEELDRAGRPHDLTFRWVRGHNGNENNERCDRLAVGARKELALAIADDTVIHLPFEVRGFEPNRQLEFA